MNRYRAIFITTIVISTLISFQVEAKEELSLIRRIQDKYDCFKIFDSTGIDPEEIERMCLSIMKNSVISNRLESLKKSHEDKREKDINTKHL